MNKIITLLIIGIIIILSGFSPDKQVAYRYINQTISSIKEIKSLGVTIEIDERINGEIRKKKGEFKITYNPFRVYLYQILPEEGMEVLFVEGEHKNKAVINTNGFPWVNVYLDPLGNAMREGHHHSIYNSGYDFIASVVKHMKKTYSDDYLKDNLIYKGTENVNGYECHVVEFNHTRYGFKKYNILKDQTVEDLSRLFYVTPYKIMEKNDFAFDYDDNLKGKTLHIPTGYAKRIVFYIADEFMLPTRIVAYDEKGLFGDYIYSNIQINPGFKDSEFSTDNDEYGF
ncbi:MAG: DUF1571 domain-containing protein [Bacteroidetes bacterium]|jgi:hypothetical protein|nr:DUF1571 domain-containing protein [Bacteroidota bacterium]